MTGMVIGASGDLPRWLGRAAHVPEALIALGTLEPLGQEARLCEAEAATSNACSPGVNAGRAARSFNVLTGGVNVLEGKEI